MLTFFWGAFALIAASTRRVPWTVAPAIAMIAYGFTFYAGFLNFYLSLGLALFAAAVTWRGNCGRIGSSALHFAALSLVAHPMGFGLLVALVIYIHVAEAVPARYRWFVLVAALLLVVGVHFALPHFFRTEPWRGTKPLAMNGADQLVLFRPRLHVSWHSSPLFFGCCCVSGVGLPRSRIEKISAERIRTPLELWTILLIAAPMVPAAIWLPRIHRRGQFDQQPHHLIDRDCGSLYFGRRRSAKMDSRRTFGDRA